MLVAPDADGTDQWNECSAKVGKTVFHFWRHNRKDLFSNQFMIFKFFQLNIQHPPGDVRDLSLKLAWPFVAFVNEPDEAHLPFAIQYFTDHVKSAVERRDSLFFVHKNKYTTGAIGERYG